jgi:hypothetical protein
MQPRLLTVDTGLFGLQHPALVAPLMQPRLLTVDTLPGPVSPLVGLHVPLMQPRLITMDTCMLRKPWSATPSTFDAATA